MNKTKWYAKPIYLVVALVLILFLGAGALTPQVAMAQTWPTTWIQIDTDEPENGTSDDARDGEVAYYADDGTYLYLRLCVYGTAPDIENARFKWFFDTDDTGGATQLRQQGGSILGAESMVFVENSMTYLLSAGGDEAFSEYEPTSYMTTPGPVTDATVAGYQVGGKCVDMYVSYAELGVSDLSGILRLMWATDQENNNLEQAPNTDTSDGPISIEEGDVVLVVSKIDTPDPVADGATLTYDITVQNTGSAEATGVVIVDDYDEDLLDITDNDGGTDNGDTITWSGVTISAGGSVSYTVTATPDDNVAPYDLIPDGTVIDNTITATMDTVEDSTTISTTISSPTPILYVEKTDTPDPVADGATLTYVITVENTGNADATNVVIVDDYDQTILTITGTDGGTDNGDTITWDGGITIPNGGGSVSYTVTATVSPSAGDGTVIENDVSVTCEQQVEASTQITTTVSTPPPPPPPPYYGAVGGDVYPINKVGLIAPWIALAMVILTGGFYLIRRRFND